jgi:hypothetical protein
MPRVMIHAEKRKIRVIWLETISAVILNNK